MTEGEIKRIRQLSLEILEKKDPARTAELTRELDALLAKQKAEDSQKSKSPGCE